MNPRRLAGAIVLAAVAFVVGRTWTGAVAAGVVVALAVLAAAAADLDDRRRLRQVTDEVGAWLGRREHRPLSLRGGSAWRRLGVALNSLGAAYHRRGAKLEQERPWRRDLVDSLVQPALLFSSEGRMLAANDAARELLGIAIDATDVTVVQAVGSTTLVNAVREARETGMPVTVDSEHGEHHLRSVVSLVGEQTLLIISDRTQERRVEELRRNFVVNASHELKTPVTGIQTLAEALAVTVRSDPDRVAPLVHRLGDEAQRLARLVYDLLDLRRLEERGPLERAPVDLAELTRRVVADLVPRAERREVELAVDAPDHALVAGVPGDLELVLKNLIGNAVQYNHPGGSVDIRIEPADGAHQVAVSDTGIGIPQHDLARIFERFYRVDTARSRETGGTGLGLSLVRHAVERHGGSIQVDSLLGEGTTFTLVIPVDPPD